MNTRISTSIATLAMSLAAFGVQAAQKTVGVCSTDGSGGGNVISVLAEDGWKPINGLVKTLNNTGSVAKNAFVTLSADAGISADAELRVGFSVDGATPAFGGPQNFANQAQYWETRSTSAIVSIPPGSHTLQAMMYVSGAAGKQGIVDDRCMTVVF